MATQPLPLRRSARLQVQKQDWSTVLPSELWECIGDRLPSGRDAASFRSMFKRWRDALPFTKFAPLLMLPFDPESPEGTVTFYRPTDGETFTRDLPAVRGKVVCGSSHGWLALVDEAACVTLLNPVTRTTVALPPTDDRFALDFRRPACMVDGRWVHQSFPGGVIHDVKLDQTDVKLDQMRDVFFSDVVLSSRADSGDCIAMALLKESTQVTFCRIGVDASWRLLSTGLTHEVFYIVHCRNRFLAINYNGQVAICNVVGATATVRPMQRLDLPPKVSPSSYLQLNGELHLVGTVMQQGSTTNRTRLYKCNVFARRPVWSRVTNTGDVTLLTAHNVAAGHAGGSVLGLEKNSVYYSGHVGRCAYPDRCKPNQWNHVLEIIDIANGTSEWFSYHQDTRCSPEALCWILQNPWTQGHLPVYQFALFMVVSITTWLKNGVRAIFMAA